MKKTVILEKNETRIYEINVEELMIEIKELGCVSEIDFQKIKVTGKVKSMNEAMEIAQRF